MPSLITIFLALLGITLTTCAALMGYVFIKMPLYPHYIGKKDCNGEDIEVGDILYYYHTKGVVKWFPEHKDFLLEVPPVVAGMPPLKMVITPEYKIIGTMDTTPGFL